MTYPKCKPLNDAPANFFEGSVVVEEKLNVFPITFSVDDGKVSLIAVRGAPATALDYIQDLADRLKPGWTYYAGTPYGYPEKPLNGIVLFDVEREHPQDFLDWSAKQMIASSLELGVPQLIYEGKPMRYEGFMPFLETPSALGGGEVSGIVIKNYDALDSNGKVIMASMEGFPSGTPKP